MMKKLKIMMLLTVISLLTLTNCKSDDNNEDNNSNEFVTVKIDGTSWSSSSNFDLTSASKGTNLLSVHGSNDTGEAVRITINDYAGVGTYTTGDDVLNTNSISFVTVTPIANWSSTFDIGTGTIEITSDENGVVEGNFSFEAYNT